MFTGIITAIGRIESLTHEGGDICMQIAVETGLDLAASSIGDSISIHGVCLTVTKIEEQMFSVDISNETLACTSLGEKQIGTKLNLEPALRVGDQLGGHLVSGHVDGTANLLHSKTDGRSTQMWFSLPESLLALVAPKGSITIDGVSLTVNEIKHIDNGQAFSVNLIPHTLECTSMGKLQAGDLVNLEIDILARYLQRQLETQQ